MLKIFSSCKLFLTILFGFLIFPLLAYGKVVYPSYDWPRIVLFSFLAFLILFLVWLISPIGIIFILASLAQFLVQKKAIRLIAWIFQGLVLVFTTLLGILGLFYVVSLYGEEKYILLFGLIGGLFIVWCLVIGVMVSQIIWQTRHQQKSQQETTGTI